MVKKNSLVGFDYWSERAPFEIIHELGKRGLRGSLLKHEFIQLVVLLSAFLNVAKEDAEHWSIVVVRGPCFHVY